MAAYKLLGNTLCHAEDVSRVLVIVSHERFTAELAISRRIIEPFCDLFLQVDVQNVGRAPSRVVQIGAQTQEKIVRRLDPSLVAFA